ncbi:MAG: tetratricopeptide repeat protein [bacterium]|nr:tetratricopeptide repeat protein [bacterium]
MPSDADEAWNQRWRHVYPVDVEVKEARTKGLSIPDLMSETERAKVSKSLVPSDKKDRLNEKSNGAVQSFKQASENPAVKTADLVALLTPEISTFLQIEQVEPGTKAAENALYWLSRTYYLNGLMLSKQRLPQTSGNYERQAWPEEELSYDTALAEFEKFLKDYPDSELAEDAAYHVAAINYHLTYRGHHRHQLEKAQQAYETFIQNYPKSDLAVRAGMNLLGLALEIARIDGKGFDQVVESGNQFISDHTDMGEYEEGRAKLIVAEALFDGPKDYEKCRKISKELMERFSNSNEIGIIGTIYRLYAYSNYYLMNYQEAIYGFSFVIDAFSSPEYNFNYRINEKLAAAHYWRGMSFQFEMMYEQAAKDFKFVINHFPDSVYTKSSRRENEFMESTLHFINERRNKYE